MLPGSWSLILRDWNGRRLGACSIKTTFKATFKASPRPPIAFVMISGDGRSASLCKVFAGPLRQPYARQNKGDTGRLHRQPLGPAHRQIQRHT